MDTHEAQNSSIPLSSTAFSPGYNLGLPIEHSASQIGVSSEELRHQPMLEATDHPSWECHSEVNQDVISPPEASSSSSHTHICPCCHGKPSCLGYNPNPYFETQCTHAYTTNCYGAIPLLINSCLCMAVMSCLLSQVTLPLLLSLKVCLYSPLHLRGVRL
jgi:hypothetical protein